MSFLDRRDWVYLLSLLIPLVAYDLALKVVGLASGQPGSGVWEALRLLRSELLFDASACPARRRSGSAKLVPSTPPTRAIRPRWAGRP
jgi:hypothetical protein